MSSKPVILTVKPRGKPIKRLPKEATVTNSDSAADLYKQIAGAAQFDINRLRITIESDGKLIPNDRDVKISSLALSTVGGSIQVKDLGPQIAWRTVFIVEYLGPILIHPLIYLARPYIYSWPTLKPTAGTPEGSSLQKFTMALVILHFLKREYETIAVHRFSLSTMPAFNIFKNSAHYWLLAGLNIAYFTYSPSSWAQTTSPVSLLSDPLTVIGLVLFTFGEIANLYTHQVLRDLRTEGTTERGIPKGFGFSLVTCPNYMFECVAWIGITLVSRSASTAVFLAVAGAQMAAWGWKKERRYRKEFGDKYKKKRFAMIPFVV